MSAELVRIEDLRVRFEARRGLLRTVPVHAVDGVSLTIRRGETVAVVGESGSGKTTLGRATLRLVPSAAGRIAFDGQDITMLRRRDLKTFRRRAQVIPQDPYASISPYLTVEQIVAEPLVIHAIGDRTQRARLVADVLEQVGLRPAGDFAALYPHLLSGGQRQRTAIARAMITAPDYLVADEPASMIDASSRAEILALLRQLQAGRGLGMLLITHDIANARHFADRVAVMYRGRIVEEGSPQQVVEEPLHPYTRALVAAVPEPDPANRHQLRPVVGGEPPDPTAPVPGCPFHPRCPEAIRGTCDVTAPALVRRADVQDPGLPTDEPANEVPDDAHRRVACHLYPASAAPPMASQR